MCDCGDCGDCDDGDLSGEEQRRRDGFRIDPRFLHCTPHSIDLSDSECGSAKRRSPSPPALTPATAKRRRGRQRVERPCHRVERRRWCALCLRSERKGKNVGKCGGPLPLSPSALSAHLAVQCKDELLHVDAPAAEWLESNFTPRAIELLSHHVVRAALRAHGYTCCDDDGDPDSASASLVGRRLQKQFVSAGGRLKPFVGKVDSFDGTYYRIVYRDGDTEEMTEAEVREHLQPERRCWPPMPYVPAVDGLGRATLPPRRGTPHAAAAAPAVPNVEVARLRRKNGALIAQVRRLRRQLAQHVVAGDDSTVPAAPPSIVLHLQTSAAVGNGFGSTRIRRTHAEVWEKQIMEKYPGDVRKQIEMATDISRRFSVDTTKPIAVDDKEMSQREIHICVTIATSMRLLIQRLQATSTGRLTNNLRLAYRILNMGAACLVSASPLTPGLAPRAKFLGSAINTMQEERNRFREWVQDHNTLLYTARGKKRSDAYPVEWAQYVAACWAEVSRRSEKARDEVRDRDSDEKAARVRKCYLEVRIGVACKMIIELCKKHFTADFVYSDKKARPGFKAKPEFVRRLRPYYVVKSFGRRETSLCVYHLKWHFVATALWAFQKRLREKGKVPKDQPALPQDPFLMLRCLLCPRTNDLYANIDCRDNKCEQCKDLRLLVGKDGKGGLLKANELDSASHGVAVKWERWEKSENPVTGKPGWDFRTVTTDIADVIKELKPPYASPSSALGPRCGWFQQFCEHHDLSRYMDDQKKHKRRKFLRGCVHVVEDFSENGSFTVKLEHQTRYYETHSYTLFGCVVDSHVEDRADLSDEEKAALIALLDANNLPHIITDTHIMLSEDTVHDPAAVMHFNGKVLIPKLKEMIPTLKHMHLTTDGAPTQFMHKDLYFWISRCKRLYGITMDWVIGAAAHSKDLSDSECGGAKHSVDTKNVEHSASDEVRGDRISTVPEVIAHLRTPYPVGYGTTKKTMKHNKGKGIRARYFYHIPLKTISRRHVKAESLDGSKKLHQFIDIGQPGKLLVRHRPCHLCPGCMALDKEKIINECQHTDRAGQAYIADIKPVSGQATLPTTRDAVAQLGRRLSAAAKPGDFVAIELQFNNLPWLIGEVVGRRPHYRYTGQTKAGYFGEVKANDWVLKVRRWLPIMSGGGSSVFEEIPDSKGGIALAFDKDVRLLMERAACDDKDFKVRRRRAGAHVENVKVAAGAVFEYMFGDRDGQWFKGTVQAMNADGMTADVVFDDGDPYHNLPVWGDLLGGRIKVISGGVPIEVPSTTAPQRHLLPAVRASIQEAIC